MSEAVWQGGVWCEVPLLPKREPAGRLGIDQMIHNFLPTDSLHCDLNENVSNFIHCNLFTDVLREQITGFRWMTM